MKIDFLCPSGSPIDVLPEDIAGRGVGGAELALLTLTEVLSKRGHNVTVFNQSQHESLYGGVLFRPVRTFESDAERDAVVLFRTQDRRFPGARGRKVFWSCDQFTSGNYSNDIFPYAERVVCISDRHATYFIQHYKLAPDRITVIGLGVRTWEYVNAPPKVPGQCIFCSVPDRGQQVLRLVWDRIVDAVPHATLVITSDYNLWGIAGSGGTTFRLKWVGVRNVTYEGLVPRARLVQLQMQSDLMVYPCTYDELFCISAAECQVAGAVPITSDMGALVTTNLYGKIIHGDPNSSEWQARFATEVIQTLQMTKALPIRQDICMRSRDGVFDWDKLAVAWEVGVLS